MKEVILGVVLTCVLILGGMVLLEWHCESAKEQYDYYIAEYGVTPYDAVWWKMAALRRYSNSRASMPNEYRKLLAVVDRMKEEGVSFKIGVLVDYDGYPFYVEPELADIK